MSASEAAFVSSPDLGKVYKIDLQGYVVQKAYHVGGHPQYISFHDNKLFIEGEVGPDGWAYIDVFDLEREEVIKRIPTGVVRAGPVVGETELIYAIQNPKPEILFVDFRHLNATALSMPDRLVPGSLALTPDMMHLFIVATEYQEVGIPRQTVLLALSLKDRQIKIIEKLPNHTDSIAFLGDIFLIHVSKNAEKDQFILRRYREMKIVQAFEVPYFCEQYTNRQKYAALPTLGQFVVAGGDCPGDEELEENQPTVLAFTSAGNLTWKVTNAADGVPAPFTLATLADGRIVFVASGFGLGILDPKTGRLLRRIRIGNDNALWGLAVDEQKMRQQQ